MLIIAERKSIIYSCNKVTYYQIMFLWGEYRFEVSTCLFQYFFNRLHWCLQWPFFLCGILTLFFLSHLVLCKYKQYTFADQNVHNVSEMNVLWYIEKCLLYSGFVCLMLFYIWCNISWLSVAKPYWFWWKQGMKRHPPVLL